MKIYVTDTGLHYREVDGYWEFWCKGHWKPSKDAKSESCWHKEWLDSLKLVGNNFRLK